MNNKKQPEIIKSIDLSIEFVIIYISDFIRRKMTMDKNKFIEMKRNLLAFGLAIVMIGTAGCSSNKDENETPRIVSISSEYSNIDDYYKFVIQNEIAIKAYNSQNVYLLFDKETYEVTEYIYYEKDVLGGLSNIVELYDLSSEAMLVYSDGIGNTYNEEYYNYIRENNYQICLAEASDYVEGHIGKDYYTWDEIRELESQIVEGFKVINSVKVKTIK